MWSEAASLTLDCQRPEVEAFFEVKHLGHWAETGMVAKGCFWIQQPFLEENLLSYL